MRKHFPEPKSLGGRVKVEVDFSNHATKDGLKIAMGAYTLPFAKKSDLANLKSDADKLDIDKLKNVSKTLSSLKSKVGVDKLVLVPLDLSKLSDVVKNDFVKKDV